MAGPGHQDGEDIALIASRRQSGERHRHPHHSVPEESARREAAPAHPPAASKWSPWNNGLACIVIAATTLSFTQLCVKLLPGQDGGPRVPVFEITFVRSGLSIIATVYTLARTPNTTILGAAKNVPLLFLRGFTGASAMVCYYLALVRLPLGDCSAVFFLNPVLTAVAAWAFLSEPLPLVVLAGVLLSTTGAIVISQPPFLFGEEAALQQEGGPEVRTAGLLFAAAAAVLAATAFLIIRILGNRENSIVVALWFHGTAMMVSAVPLVMGWPKPAVLPDAYEAMLLLLIAAGSFVGQVFLNRGFQIENASRAAAANCVQVMYGYAMGLLLLGEESTVWSLLGAAMVVGGVVAVAQGRAQAAAGSNKAHQPPAVRVVEEEPGDIEMRGGTR